MLDMHPAVLLWQVADLVMLLPPELRCWACEMAQTAKFGHRQYLMVPSVSLTLCLWDSRRDKVAGGRARPFVHSRCVTCYSVQSLIPVHDLSTLRYGD
jgi:hypothetical protein